MKNGIKMIVALLALSVVVTSCNKEKKLADRLEGIWDVTSIDYTENEVCTYYSATGSVDSTQTNPNADPNLSISYSASGTIDFVSEDNFVQDVDVVITQKYTFGSTTTTTTQDVELDVAGEFFATGEDQVTTISDDEATVFEVTTNEKDEQVWVNTEVTKVVTDLGNDREKICVTTAVLTMSLKKQED